MEHCPDEPSQRGALHLLGALRSGRRKRRNLVVFIANSASTGNPAHQFNATGVTGVLAVSTEARAIIRRRYSRSFRWSLKSLVPAAEAASRPAATEIRRSNDVRRSHALRT